MLKPRLSALVLVALLGVSTMRAQDAKAVVAGVAKAMGAANLQTVQYTGTGYWFTFEQNYGVNDGWPKFTLKSYARTLDFENGASEEKASWSQFEPNERGGGFIPLKGALNLDAFVSGDTAWNAGGPNGANPAPATVEERQVWLTLTPFGWIKAAMAGSPIVSPKKVNGMTVVSFTFKGKYKVNGYVDKDNMLAKTETWIPHPILGDMPLEVTYSDYKDFSGAKFPMKILEKEGRYPILDLTVTNVVPNAPVNIPVPANAKTATVQPIRVVSMPLADGVWLLRAGIQSMGVEFKDYTVIVDSGPNEERSEAVMAEMKRLVPGKPVKYVVNSHHHLDHAGGLRTFVAEGATIITGGEANKQYYQRLFRLPRTLEPDRLAKNPRPANIIAVKDKYVLTDGARSMEFYIMQNNPHEPGLLMAYLPKEKLALVADSVGGVAAGVPLPGAPPPVSVNNIGLGDNVRDNIQRLKLDVQTFVPSHGMGTMTYADLEKQIEGQHAQIEVFDKANGGGKASN